MCGDEAEIIYRMGDSSDIYEQLIKYVVAN
jgi:hypothetical protein